MILLEQGSGEIVWCLGQMPDLDPNNTDAYLRQLFTVQHKTGTYSGIANVMPDIRGGCRGALVLGRSNTQACHTGVSQDENGRDKAVDVVPGDVPPRRGGNKKEE